MIHPTHVEACYDDILARMMVGVKYKSEPHVIQLRKANIPKNWLPLFYLLDVHQTHIYVSTNLELPGGTSQL